MGEAGGEGLEVVVDGQIECGVGPEGGEGGTVAAVDATQAFGMGDGADGVSGGVVVEGGGGGGEVGLDLHAFFDDVDGHPQDAREGLGEQAGGEVEEGDGQGGEEGEGGEDISIIYIKITRYRTHAVLFLFLR